MNLNHIYLDYLNYLLVLFSNLLLLQFLKKNFPRFNKFELINYKKPTNKNSSAYYLKSNLQKCFEFKNRNTLLKLVHTSIRSLKSAKKQDQLNGLNNAL